MISLIHPSRGRPEKSFDTCKRWIDRSGSSDVQIVISIDRDDHKSIEYAHNAEQLDFYMIGRQWKFPLPAYDGSLTHPRNAFYLSRDNKSVVDATNVAAANAHGDIFIYLSDDFDCPENWADLVIKEFEDATGPRLVKVDDCLQPFHVRVLTIPIMNRALYERLGYFWHPDYKSMHVDCDLYETVQKIGALKMCPNLKFEHQHVSVGKALDDETYRRSSANWDQGLQVFNKRKKQGFPI